MKKDFGGASLREAKRDVPERAGAAMEEGGAGKDAAHGGRGVAPAEF